jgi:hypothetical protein
MTMLDNKMTMLDKPTSTSDADSVEALFKEARQRRQRRWRIGITAVMALMLAIAGVLYSVQTSRGGSQGGGLASGSESLPQTPSGPDFNQPNHVPSSWITSTYRADGLMVTFSHPPSWTPRLPAQGFHYADLWSFVANFPLNRNWCVRGTSSVTCLWKNVGTFPARGVLMTFGTSGYQPGPPQGLGPGVPISINGREGRMLQDNNGSACLGVGASRSLGVTVNDGEHYQGKFDLSFCFSGPNEWALQDRARVVVSTLHIRSDPTAPYLSI